MSRDVEIIQGRAHHYKQGIILFAKTFLVKTYFGINSVIDL